MPFCVMTTACPKPWSVVRRREASEFLFSESVYDAMMKDDRGITAAGSEAYSVDQTILGLYRSSKLLVQAVPSEGRGECAWQP
jgi:hypothetical protein